VPAVQLWAITGGGEGILGLAWAFLVAGSSSVIAGQWEVRDRSQVLFLSRYYRALANGKDNAQAIQIGFKINAFQGRW